MRDEWLAQVVEDIIEPDLQPGLDFFAAGFEPTTTLQQVIEFGVSGVVAYDLDGKRKWTAEVGDKTAGFGTASSRRGSSNYRIHLGQDGQCRVRERRCRQFPVTQHATGRDGSRRHGGH